MTTPNTPEAVLSEREAIIEWIRNNYQDHSIDSLCDGIRALAGRPAVVGAEPVAWRRMENGSWVYYETNAWPDAEPLYAAPLPSAEQAGAVTVWSQVARLMRYIDAYAYDYNKLGKVAGSRFEVERELCAALATKGEQAGAVVASDLHGAIMNLPARPPENFGANQVGAYKVGHRDARHDAAELVLATTHAGGAAQQGAEGEPK